MKGAYWDQELIIAGQKNWPSPVFTEKSETDANFERLARIILENRGRIKLACASHNVRSIAAVVETAKEVGATGEDLEFQVLYGMGEPVRNALRKAGLQVRVYCPVGEMLQGMSYLVRRLLENTANESFLRQAFSLKLPRGNLLSNPADKLKKMRTRSAKSCRTKRHWPLQNRTRFRLVTRGASPSIRRCLKESARQLSDRGPLNSRRGQNSHLLPVRVFEP